MNHHTSTRIPVNDDYALLVGKAVYAFAYYEWTIIWIIEFLESGFVSEYSRERPMTSGAVQQRFKNAIDHLQSEPNSITTVELNSCLSAFSGLVIKRNALIHAHPCTDVDGSQVLAYQTQPSKPLPDMKWPVSEVQNTIAEIDATACDAGTILDKLRS
jgi:hypothetical protein